LCLAGLGGLNIVCHILTGQPDPYRSAPDLLVPGVGQHIGHFYGSTHDMLASFEVEGQRASCRLNTAALIERRGQHQGKDGQRIPQDSTTGHATDPIIGPFDGHRRKHLFFFLPRQLRFFFLPRQLR